MTKCVFCKDETGSDNLACSRHNAKLLWSTFVKRSTLIKNNEKRKGHHIVIEDVKDYKGKDRTK